MRFRLPTHVQNALPFANSRSKCASVCQLTFKMRFVWTLQIRCFDFAKICFDFGAYLNIKLRCNMLCQLPFKMRFRLTNPLEMRFALPIIVQMRCRLTLQLRCFDISPLSKDNATYMNFQKIIYLNFF